jgi:DNA replication protein DnaC
MSEIDTGPCGKCGGTGFVIVGEAGGRRARPCGCRRAPRAGRTGLDDFLEAARIPRRYHDCDFENYAADYRPHQLSLQGAKERARRYVEEYPLSDRGLLWMGPPGVGKTHLAVATLRRLALEKGVRCLFCDVQDLLRQLQATFDRQSGMTELELLRGVLSTEVALLDDLGGRQFSPWVEETLSHIVTTRYNEGRATLVTTNYMDEPRDKRDPTLQDRIGPRVYSRLQEMCHFVKVEAKDFRVEVKRADLHWLPERSPSPKENA